MIRKTIGVFFGSRSAEHDVSIVTALSAIIKPLVATNKYDVLPIYIAKDGRWFCNEDLDDIKVYRSNEISEIVEKQKPVLVELGKGLHIIKPGLRPKRMRIDIAFPATHGTFGEDGALMGIFEMAGIPYVGCDVESSAVAMNKVLAKWVTMTHKIPSTPFVSFTSVDVAHNLEGLVKAVKTNAAMKDSFPLFVKPVHLGSSIGISRVDKIEDLASAIEVAAHYDDEIIVEAGVQNLIEVTVPVMGNEQPRAAMVERPLTEAEDFFDFDKKYLGQGKKGAGKTGKQGVQGYSEIPAKLPKDIYEACEQIALDAYRAIGCAGIARVDLLIDSKAKKIYFNEINPLPGSLYAHNWAKAEVSAIELVTTLIDLAQERFDAKSKLTTTFDTNFLKQF